MKQRSLERRRLNREGAEERGVLAREELRVRGRGEELYMARETTKGRLKIPFYDLGKPML